ncbi:hypothetical protein K431DRAFT_82464 [Polychaeton citri CBS 116435]|uniref:Uncharacterized protein n=1 Tax=Polychaeton citri CBS 116435 TaxID=1314669 RepID=A0A9P4QFW5_9PEZI|nr:hypothetical protein K431DRAFT_82464 [Polychaeton citri CBS 116435]
MKHWRAQFQGYAWHAVARQSPPAVPSDQKPTLALFPLWPSLSCSALLCSALLPISVMRQPVRILVSCFRAGLGSSAVLNLLHLHPMGKVEGVSSITHEIGSVGQIMVVSLRQWAKGLTLRTRANCRHLNLYALPCAVRGFCAYHGAVKAVLARWDQRDRRATM